MATARPRTPKARKPSNKALLLQYRKAQWDESETRKRLANSFPDGPEWKAWVKEQLSRRAQRQPGDPPSDDPPNTLAEFRQWLLGWIDWWHSEAVRNTLENQNLLESGPKMPTYARSAREALRVASALNITSNTYATLAELDDKITRKELLKLYSDLAEQSQRAERNGASSQLTETQWKVLRCIGQSPVALKGPDACADVRERPGKEALIHLESVGLVHRPHGERRGYALTDSGKQLFEANEKKP